MNKKETGGPAFPTTGLAQFEYGDSIGQLHKKRVEGLVGGMTLRDWFAGLALTCLIKKSTPNSFFDDYAKDAYELADAMLKARDA